MQNPVRNAARKTKKPIFKRWWFWAICVVLVIVIIGGSGGEKVNLSEPTSVSERSNETSKPTATPAPTKDPAVARQEYIESCEEVAYNDIARDPDKYKGTPVVFSGTVVQVSEGWLNTVTYRIATNGGYDDIIYVTYTREEGESRILEDDVITLYGDCDGVTSYVSVLGGNITIPSVKMKYFGIN